MDAKMNLTTEALAQLSNTTNSDKFTTELTNALNQLPLDNESDNDTNSVTTSSTTSDRSLETRNARLASALLSLDEDIPTDADDSIKDLIKAHTPTFSPMFDENYQDYKAGLAAKRASEKKLPRSKGRRAGPTTPLN